MRIWEKNMESKPQLRKRIKDTRNALSETERTSYSAQICKRLVEQSWYVNAHTILVYSAIQSEVDLSLFCAQARKDGKILYFPKVFGEKMEFFRVDDATQLEKGAFSVMEPNTEAFALQRYQSDIGAPVLVPGVAFSKRGERIGYGKGYYDRYILAHPELFPVGICFSCQLLDEIPAEPQDIAMHEIVTEKQTYSMNEIETDTGMMEFGK